MRVTRFDDGKIGVVVGERIGAMTMPAVQGSGAMRALVYWREQRA